MKIEQIRNATIHITYAGQNFLVDPWLAAKDTMGSFADFKIFQVPDQAKMTIKMPMCELPKSIDEILTGIDAYIITHVHPDHIDMNADGTVGDMLHKDVLTFVQSEEDATTMKNSGFTKVHIMQQTGKDLANGIRMFKTPGCHGTIVACGPSCGFIFQHPDEKTLYVAGDTIWYPEVKKVLQTYNPDVIVLNTCAAELVDNGRLIMMTMIFMKFIKPFQKQKSLQAIWILLLMHHLPGKRSMKNLFKKALRIKSLYPKTVKFTNSNSPVKNGITAIITQ